MNPGMQPRLTKGGDEVPSRRSALLGRGRALGELEALYSMDTLFRTVCSRAVTILAPTPESAERTDSEAVNLALMRGGFAVRVMRFGEVVLAGTMGKTAMGGRVANSESRED